MENNKNMVVHIKHQVVEEKEVENYMGYGFGWNKHSLLWLLNTHRITMISLAHKAQVPIPAIHSMAWGIAVPRDDAEKTLAALNTIAKTAYTLHDVHIKTYE